MYCYLCWYRPQAPHNHFNPQHFIPPESKAQVWESLQPAQSPRCSNRLHSPAYCDLFGTVSKLSYRLYPQHFTPPPEVRAQVCSLPDIQPNYPAAQPDDIYRCTAICDRCRPRARPYALVPQHFTPPAGSQRTGKYGTCRHFNHPAAQPGDINRRIARCSRCRPQAHP